MTERQYLIITSYLCYIISLLAYNINAYLSLLFVIGGIIDMALAHKNKSKIIKYEFWAFSAHEDFLDEQIKQAQDDGWQIAGEASIKYDSHSNAKRIYIPLKRKI